MLPASVNNARVIVEPFRGDPSIDDAVVSFCCGASPAILETSLTGGPYGRFTILACDPCDLFVVEASASARPLDDLAERIAGYPRVEGPPNGLPFSGAWIGHLSYEAGLTIEQISPTTRSDVGLPVVRFALYDAAAVFDHAKGCWHLVVVDWPRGCSLDRSSPAHRLDTLRGRLDDALMLLDTSNGGFRPVRGAIPKPDEGGRRYIAPRSHGGASLGHATHHSMCSRALAEAEPPESGRLRVATTPPEDSPVAVSTSNWSYEDYLAAVRRAKRYIEAGDIYQVNLSRRFTTRTHASPPALYRRLRLESPSSHAALLIWDDKAIISSSPELFLELRDGHVVTRPIKGTRPRGGDAFEEASNRRELIDSEKDRAELNMIVDLLRNDLGRVCRFGSVRVVSPGEIERHPTVFHRVATITGTLDPACDWLDLLKSAFPGGSITGAPKIRAMEIIDELEPTQRGVYCGSIGMIGLDGSLSLNIAIRTMVQVGDVVHWHAGGAIVADSEPEAEHEELLAKAAAMTRAVCRVSEASPSVRKEVPIT